MLNKDDIIGQPIDRLDGRAKVTGGAFYAAEFPIKDVVHGVLVQSTIAKGRISEIETRAAEAAPGVIAVITHKNAPKLAGDKTGQSDKKLLLLQDDAVHFSRQHIGIVVADTFEHAVHAGELVRVSYTEEKPAVILEEKISEAYTPAAQPPRNSLDSARGDVAQGLGAARVRCEQTYKTPVENHNPMEPHATIAVWSADGKLTLYDATQGVFPARRKLAAAFGVPPANVRVIAKYIGGGFGCKGSVWPHVVLAAMAARQVNRPVKVVLDREQMFGPVGFRPRTIQQVSLGATADGKLTAVRHAGISQTSTYDEFIEPVARTARMLYACPNIETSHRLVRLDAGTPTFMRAPGEASGSFALESAMDELAYSLKIDPIELRLRNYAERDEDKNLPWSSKSLKECYRQGAEKFGWARRTPAPRSMRDGRQLIGYGMATATYPTNRSAASALARLSAADGTALVQSGSQDLGTGTYTVMAQIAADALGLPVNKVKFNLGDTEMPETPVSGGSQTAASVGSAVHEAALALLRRVIQVAVADQASPLYGASEADIAVRDGRLALKNDASKGETYQAILTRAKMGVIEARIEAKPGAEKGQYSMHSFGAQFAEVRVDEDLGMVRIARWVGAFGIGRVLNAKTARSQLMGGIVYGLGMALMEETVTDRRSGRVITPNLAEYHVPVGADVPAIDVLIVDERDEHVNPIGVKGIGEIGITGVAAAVANAVYHATAKRIRELPIRPDKLI